jgi:hypothetical protein
MFQVETGESGDTKQLSDCFNLSSTGYHSGGAFKLREGQPNYVGCQALATKYIIIRVSPSFLGCIGDTYIILFWQRVGPCSIRSFTAAATPTQCAVEKLNTGISDAVTRSLQSLLPTSDSPPVA